MAVQVSDLKVHPRFKTALRPLTPAELSRLKTLILQVGEIQDPIKYWRNARDILVVDGHHRLEIYDGLKDDLPAPPLKEMTFGHEDDVVEWIQKNQAARRNLTPDELQAMCDQVAPSIVKEAKERKLKAARKPRGSVRKLGSVQTTEPNLAKPSKEASEMIQDAVEKETGQRPRQAQARAAAQKARGATKSKSNGKVSPARKPAHSTVHESFVKLINFCLARKTVTRRQFADQVKGLREHSTIDLVRALLDDTGPYLAKYQYHQEGDESRISEREHNVERSPS